MYALQTYTKSRKDAGRLYNLHVRESWINVRLITNAAGLFGTSVYASVAVHSIWIFNYYEIINGFRSIKGLQ